MVTEKMGSKSLHQGMGQVQGPPAIDTSSKET
jgi:hypothetical protein